ncbi:hypothetical protein F9L33_09585 [Amylibacter sp. SFDW26]|uniref:hypothetical protein n=1 Tax=Amylibacter sp. SFDW26 TaxID=2652722 RepID=UPI0012624B21|nr:hypothetical protein [Amylibacter sp. SFDW26]KAB7613621.1 hypothetical protein F9L33_09585 [Amylibacter sp. SFDW26]
MLIVRVIYYCIVFICIGISAYLTYFGFLSTFHELTLPFTAVIALGLLGADYLIQKYRENGQSLRPAFVLFSIAAFFSLLSNFNFLYTNFMRSDVAAIALREQFDNFRDDLTSTKGALLDLKSVKDESSRRDIIVAELKNMKKQMDDPNRSGCGALCRDHIKNINGQLTVSPTNLAIPSLNSSATARDKFYETYSGLVFSAMDAEPSADEYVRVRLINDKIDRALTEFSSPEVAIQSNKGLDVLGELSEISLEIERSANSILPEDKSAAHTFINPGLGRLGEIVYSLQNGFIDRPNLSATILSIIASLVVDIFPVLFALIALRPGILREKTEIDDLL